MQICVVCLITRFTLNIVKTNQYYPNTDIVYIIILGTKSIRPENNINFLKIIKSLETTWIKNSIQRAVIDRA